MYTGRDQSRQTGLDQVARQEDHAAQADRRPQVEVRAPGEHRYADRVNNQNAPDHGREESERRAEPATSKRDQPGDEGAQREGDQGSRR